MGYPFLLENINWLNQTLSLGCKKYIDVITYHIFIAKLIAPNYKSV
jgi:hypothetical protein